MNLTKNIRMAGINDALAVAKIYEPYCLHSPSTFEIVPPDHEEIGLRIARVLKHYPWLVYEEEGEMLGYAYAAGHKERPAYRFSADVSIYLKDGFQKKGIGTALYTVLIDLVKRQGFYNAYAGITLPNDASVGLHRRMGFEPIAIYRRVGFKLGRWHDTQWWHLRLNEPADDGEPEETISIHELLFQRGMLPG